MSISKAARTALLVHGFSAKELADFDAAVALLEAGSVPKASKPRKARKPKSASPKATAPAVRTCKRCGATGHNSRTCPEAQEALDG